MKGHSVNTLAFLLGAVLVLVVVADYRASLLQARQNFWNESHNLARGDSQRMRQSLGWITATLDLVKSDQILSTFVAADVALPRSSRARVEPAFRLLAQRADVVSLQLLSNSGPKPRVLMSFETGTDQPAEVGQAETRLAGLAELFKANQAPYLVSPTLPMASRRQAFYYAAPLYHRELPLGMVTCLVLSQELRRGTSPQFDRVREVRSGLLIESVPPAREAGSYYHEVLDLGQGWKLEESRPDSDYWARHDVRSAHRSLALGLTAVVLAMLAAWSLALRRSAQAASRAKSEFMASVSHEIRTPLNGILGMTNLALKTRLSVVQSEYLRTASSSAESVLGLINDILDFAKIEAGALDISPIPVELRQLLHQALKTLAHKAAEKEVELVLWVDPRVPRRVLADPVRLRQVVLNLVSNAVKFTAEGEILVKVRPRLDKLHFSVRDTGIGIAADRQRAIFELFTQADSTTTRRYGGTGLGLSISRELVGRMGGEIWVESEPERGSVFHFTADLSTLEPMPEPADFKGRQALVVEPNPTARGLLEMLLSEWNFRVESLSEAEVYERVRPGAVVLIPAARVEDFRQLQGVRLIGLASRTEELEVEGADAVVAKPILPSELLARLAGEEPSQTRLTTLPSLKLLLADDSPINRKIGTLMLEEQGHSVVVARDGAEAVELALGDAYDLILMDMQMPGVDGLEACRQLRRRGSKVPIIALTGNALREDQKRCLEAGMNGHVVKPIDERRLNLAMERVLTGRKLAAPRVPGDRRSSRPWDGRVFRADVSLERVGGDPRNLNTVMVMFLELADQHVEAVRGALKACDPEGLSLAVHALKGTVAAFDALAVVRVLRRLSERARAGVAEPHDPLLEELELEVEKLKDAFRQFISEPEK
ncbi:MAG: ATP-binding protein [Vulcanimicrobiota bacterium]